MSGDWRERAACRGEDLAVFFPTSSPGTEDNPAARAICDRCPVRKECLETELARGMGQQFGWSGGMSASARQAVLRKRKRTRRAAA